MSIAIIAGISSLLGYNILLAPLGATSVIAFLGYQTKFAYPRNILCGYSITCLIGILSALYFETNWFVVAFAIGLSILVQTNFDVVHPPAVAMPIALMSMAEPYEIFSMIFTALLPGILLMIFVAIIFNHYILENGYPLWSDKKKKSTLP